MPLFATANHMLLAYCVAYSIGDLIRAIKYDVRPATAQERARDRAQPDFAAAHLSSQRCCADRETAGRDARLN